MAVRARAPVAPSIPAIIQKSWCVVRRTEGREWIPTSSISPAMDECRRLAAEDDRHCGADWARDNPVVAVCPVTLTTNPR